MSKPKGFTDNPERHRLNSAGIPNKTAFSAPQLPPVKTGLPARGVSPKRSERKQPPFAEKQLSEVEKMAREMVGDGGDPNKFFVSIYSDYDYIHEDEDGAMAQEGIDDLIPGFEGKGGTVKMFDSWSEAKEYIEDGYAYLGMKEDDFIVNRIVVEDRKNGVIYEQVKLFNPKNGTMREDIRDDSGWLDE